jgi:hypothetical protein
MGGLVGQILVSMGRACLGEPIRHVSTDEEADPYECSYVAVLYCCAMQVLEVQAADDVCAFLAH